MDKAEEYVERDFEVVKFKGKNIYRVELECSDCMWGVERVRCDAHDEMYSCKNPKLLKVLAPGSHDGSPILSNEAVRSFKVACTPAALWFEPK